MASGQFVRKLNPIPCIRVHGWSSLFFIAPGLHPDESGHDEGGWPAGWRCLGAEAFRRAEAGELSDEQLYPYQAAQAALKMAGAG